MSNGTAPTQPDQRLYALLAELIGAINNLQQTMASLFPQIATTVASTATAGTNGAPPAQVADYALVTINGTAFKVPLYLP